MKKFFTPAIFFTGDFHRHREKKFFRRRRHRHHDYFLLKITQSEVYWKNSSTSPSQTSRNYGKTRAMSSHDSAYLIRVKDTQHSHEVFFHPEHESFAKSAHAGLCAGIHHHYCIARKEPETDCLCTQSFGHTQCEIHTYLDRVIEHEEVRCPLASKITIETVSPDGVVPYEISK